MHGKEKGFLYEGFFPGFVIVMFLIIVSTVVIGSYWTKNIEAEKKIAESNTAIAITANAVNVGSIEVLEESKKNTQLALESVTVNKEEVTAIVVKKKEEKKKEVTSIRNDPVLTDKEKSNKISAEQIKRLWETYSCFLSLGSAACYQTHGVVH